MITHKTFHIERCDGHVLHPSIQEYLQESSISHIWDSAVYLSAFMATMPEEVSGSRVIELGAGTGMPSVVCGIMGATVLATDREDEPQLLDNLRTTFTCNGLDNAVALPLSWDDRSSIQRVLDKYPEGFDFILGADVLYSTEDFCPVISLVAHLLSLKKGAVFYTAYKNRSSRRTLKPYLDIFGLEATVLPPSTFLPACQKLGICAVIGDEGSDIKQVPCFDDIFLIKIYLAESQMEPITVNT